MDTIDSPVVASNLAPGLPVFDALDCDAPLPPISWCDLVILADGLALGHVEQVRFSTQGATCQVAEPMLEIVLASDATDLETADSQRTATLQLGSVAWSFWQPFPSPIGADRLTIDWRSNDRWPRVALAAGMQLVVPYRHTPEPGIDTFLDLPLFWITADGQVVQQASPCGVQIDDVPTSLDDIIASTAACQQTELSDAGQLLVDIFERRRQGNTRGVFEPVCRLE